MKILIDKLFLIQIGYGIAYQLLPHYVEVSDDGHTDIKLVMIGEGLFDGASDTLSDCLKRMKKAVIPSRLRD